MKQRSKPQVGELWSVENPVRIPGEICLIVDTRAVYDGIINPNWIKVLRIRSLDNLYRICNIPREWLKEKIS